MTLSRRGRRLFACLCGIAATITATPSVAQGDLLVAPTRVIIDDRRGTEVILSNIGSEEATYRVGLELRRMASDGQLVDVDPDEATEKEKAALEMVRYAPRRITLPPGQPQAVRIAARLGADLPDGEYRVHMSFRAIPKPVPVTDAPDAASGIKINLVPVYGITIPIIVRHGKVEASVAIESIALATGEHGPELHLAMKHAGTASTYGELRVVKRGGGGEPLYMARGVAIYPEVPERKVELPITPEQAAMLHGPVTVEYREMPEAGGALIASFDADLG